ncbi:amidohydrolase [Cordyceps fumosorosea ARSEF 2679]|uniref:Amidohydrolase n=1 Tax=Cordyceps fumosorosea (strain ARSEF 2679) TaxID=1081104 RepID=A0A168CB34_CORFA|nr:amidohydrolase [Cordyceps fumosorosea ARSEF 2679]OAA71175.1 amidohydrolase [Cordyceps fumosorosea ARSEF 2679]
MRLPSRDSIAPRNDVASSPPQSAATGEKEAFVITAALLIPGRGEPITDGAVTVKSGIIEWVGPASSLPPPYRNLSHTRVPVLMPGLWDCHVHFFGVADTNDLEAAFGIPTGQAALAGALTAHDLEATLLAGYTTVRELGGYGGDVWPAVRAGTIPGPNIYSSIAAISITGGHADVSTLPSSAVRAAMCCGPAPLAVCDGADACVATVRQMVRRGARVIKVCSSGGVLSLNDDPEDRQFSDAELAAMVAEAARSRRAVAAHAIGKAGIMAALRAGVKSIEHGMYLDDEVAERMRAQDAILVATQHIVRTLSSPPYLDTLPAPSRDKVIKVGREANKAYALAIRRGVKIALGTDMLSSDRGSKLAHGQNGHELGYAVELGMTPLQAIESATAVPPETLGGLAPKSGQLRAGYDADLIAVSRNPLADIKVLANADNITHVWKGGKLFKKPGVHGVYRDA